MQRNLEPVTKVDQPKMSRAGKLQRALIIDAWDPDLEVILLLKRCLRMLKVQTSTYVIGKEEYNDFGPIVALI